MVSNQRSHFLNQLKIGSSNRQLYFDTKISSSVNPLASLLQNLNMIRRFHNLNNGLYRVFPTYSRYSNSPRTTSLYARVNGRIRLSLSSLSLLNFNSPHSYYIIDTSKGLMTHKDAIRARQGGLLLLIIR